MIKHKFRGLMTAVSSMALTIGAAQLAFAGGYTPSTVLPRPEAPYAGALGETPETSSPPKYPEEQEAPKGAPNVLLIMTDDVGFGGSSVFGGPIPTGTLQNIANRGLRYNKFHTTALCSPTRAALLTGRNHHSVGSAGVVETSTGYPGYNSIIPKSAATIGEVLVQNGYNTSWFGKSHNIPEWENTPTGPFDHWPNGMGFEYFYGFNGPEADQWSPALTENRTQVEPPLNDPSYILDKDLADHAIHWLRLQHRAKPDKPFFMYYAPGTDHAPNQAPAEWIARFKGQFDQGWDKQREETFKRQKKLGIIPANAVLTPRPKEIPAWNSLTADQKKVAARLMEAYAAAAAYSDDQIGRVIDELKKSGQLENTLVIFIEGDNGSSGEGGIYGTTNDMAAYNGIAETVPYMLSRLDEIGGPMTRPNIPVGWAWAMSTPFQWVKQIASHFGGTGNGMVMSWPGHINQEGGLRSQFAHVIDIAPTIYEAAGILQPTMVNGVKQKPIEGTSLLYTLNDAKAPSRRTEQYFELWGHRALYKDGWIASTHPTRLPWLLSGAGIDPKDAKWELYHLDGDYSQSRDVAAKYPKKLAELKQAFVEQARKYNVFPIDTRALARVSPEMRPFDFNKRSSFSFHNSPQRYLAGAFPDIKNRSWTVTATLDVPAGGADGVIVTEGGRFNGWGLVVLDNRPVFMYNASDMPVDRFQLTAPEALSPGRHVVKVDFHYDGGGLGKGGAATLTVDGIAAAAGHIERTVPFLFTFEGAYIGRDYGTSLSERYQIPFEYKGRVDEVHFELGKLENYVGAGVLTSANPE